jgi:hypothetical protein
MSVTQRGKAIKEWDRCECCLTDCRDRRTGIRCYRRIGFQRHHLLRLVSQTRADHVSCGGGWLQQPQGKANGTGRNTPRGKPGQASGGHSGGQGALLQRQVDMWCFPAVGREREPVWLRATRSQHVGVTRITHQAAMRLGLTQSVTKAYRVWLRLSGEPQFVLRTEGIETLECVRSKTERRTRGSSSRM